MRRLLTAGLLAAVPSVLVTAGPIGPAWADVAVPAQVAAAWTFDTLSPDGLVADASGHAHPLTLAGSWTSTPGSAGTAAGRFAPQSFGSADGTGLAGGTDEVAVTAVLRSAVKDPTLDTPNVLQHGLYGDASQLKMQIAKDGTGRAGCRFKGTLGNLLLTGPAIDVTDGGWHGVTCWRKAGTVGVTVDGLTVTKAKEVGSIVPTRPLTVAARGLGRGDLSDQFAGDLDVVVWAVGTDARTVAPTYAAALTAP